MKALFFIQNGVGGAEKVQLRMASMLLADGWNVEFCIVMVGDEKEKMSSLLPEGCTVHEVRQHRQWQFLKEMRRVIKNAAPDVVFGSAMHINQRLALLSLVLRKQKFLLRNDNYLFTLPPNKQRTLKWTYRFADRIIAQNDEMRTELVGIGLKPERIITLHNPVDRAEIAKSASEANPYPPGGRIFVAVGRIAPQKGFDILLEAFNVVVSHIPDARLYIVGRKETGDGSEYSKLEAMVRKYGLTRNVTFTGFQSNPYPWIKNADVFVLSSRYEGLPNSLIEAQSLGVPAAAAECIPMIGRIVSNGVNGYTAQPENPGSLASAMLKAVNLKDVPMTYTPAPDSDFVKAFEF